MKSERVKKTNEKVNENNELVIIYTIVYVEM